MVTTEVKGLIMHWVVCAGPATRAGRRPAPPPRRDDRVHGTNIWAANTEAGSCVPTVAGQGVVDPPCPAPLGSQAGGLTRRPVRVCVVSSVYEDLFQQSYSHGAHSVRPPFVSYNISHFFILSAFTFFSFILFHVSNCHHKSISLHHL